MPVGLGLTDEDADGEDHDEGPSATEGQAAPIRQGAQDGREEEAHKR